MKSIVPVGSFLALLALAGCEYPKAAPVPDEAGTAAEKRAGVEGKSKLILGPQSPTPPIEPSPVPSLPANVKEGMERKDPEPGPDMARPAEALAAPKGGTKDDTPAPKDGPRGEYPKGGDAPK